METDRKVLDSWDIYDVGDMINAIEAAQDMINAIPDGYLSFLYMRKGDKNVDNVKLIEITLSDKSLAYELELS